MIRVDLITGFLGSGKTTFINEYAGYLVRQGLKVAIIVNDYGAINVDRLLLEESLGDKCHLEMVIGGDQDCTRRRLKTKLITMGMAGYDHVIVEPSGIFDVDDFFDLIYDEPLERWYEMGNVITIADAGFLQEEMEYVNEKSSDKGLLQQTRYLLASQVSKAGIVILSKFEDGDKEIIRIYLNSFLEEFKCTRQLKSLYIWKQGQISDDDFQMIRNSGYYSGEMIKLPVASDNSFDSLFYFHVRTDISRLRETIESIFRDKEVGKLIRLKGFIKDEEDNWLEINANPKMVDIKHISVGQELFIVIGENLNHEKIGSYWDEYRNAL